MSHTTLHTNGPHNTAHQWATQHCTPMSHTTLHTNGPHNTAHQWATQQCTPMGHTTMHTNGPHNNAHQWTTQQCTPMGHTTLHRKVKIERPESHYNWGFVFQKIRLIFIYNLVYILIYCFGNGDQSTVISLKMLFLFGML